MSAPPAVPGPAPETFLSGETGHVAGVRRRLWRGAADRLLDLADRARGPRLDALASAGEVRDVLVLGAYRPSSERLSAAVAELQQTRHRVRLALGSTDPEPAVPLGEHTLLCGLEGGKFQNLNRLLREVGAPRADWVLLVDDDVDLPPRFLDRFLALCEHFHLGLAQPAQSLSSHAAWRVTRRRPLSLVRETRFVEIGPVTAFSGAAAAALMPFPDLRYGWALDLHWGAVAAARGLTLGVADAVAVRHEQQPVAACYPFAGAIEEARRFLADRPHLTATEAQQTLATHRRIAP